MPRALSIARVRVATDQEAEYLAVVAELDPTVQVPPELLARVKQLVADGDPEAAGRLIPGDLLDKFAFAGDPEQVAAQAQANALRWLDVARQHIGGEEERMILATLEAELEGYLTARESNRAISR